MKTKTFIVTLLTALVLVAGIAAALLFETHSASAKLNLSQLEDGLYSSNAELISWAMNDLDGRKLSGLKLPPALAEVVLIEPDSLRIESATVAAHQGQLLPQIPGLLDRAEPLINALRTSQTTTVKGRDYTLIIKPAEGGLYLVAFKPNEHERNLLSAQQAAINRHFKRVNRLILMAAAVGVILGLLLAFLTAKLATGSYAQVLKAFDNLSRGDFDSAPDGLKADEARIYARLRTTLTFALERLGRK